MEKVEFLILRNLLYNEEYVRKVIPFIKAEYFEDFNQKVVFEEILSFVQEYNETATKEVLCIETEKRQDINDTSFKEITTLISNLEEDMIEIKLWPNGDTIYIDFAYQGIPENIPIEKIKRGRAPPKDAVIEELPHDEEQEAAENISPTSDTSVSSYGQEMSEKKKLDDVITDRKIGFIKIDVEGHEKEVLIGAERIIKNNKPVMLIEIEEKHSKKPIYDTINYIIKLGYKCYFLKNNELKKIEELKSNDDENNFIFLAK